MLRQYVEHYDLLRDVLQTVNPGRNIRIITRGVKALEENTEIRDIEVGMLKMVDLEKEILHEVCTLLKSFDIITQVITISMFSYDFLNTFTYR